MVKRFSRRGRDSDDAVGGIYADEAELDKALRYSRTREWLALIDLVIGIAGMTLALATGLSARLRDATSRVGQAAELDIDLTPGEVPDP